MTKPLSADLTHCYSLLFTGDLEAKKNRYVKAVLCFEECRKIAQEKYEGDSVFTYCLYRAARKEAQLLIELGAKSRAYRVLRKVDSLNICFGEKIDKMFVLTQLIYLSTQMGPKRTEQFKERLQVLLKEED